VEEDNEGMVAAVVENEEDAIDNVDDVVV